MRSFAFLSLLLFSLFSLAQSVNLPINKNPLRVIHSYFQNSHLPAGASTELTVEVAVDKGHYAYVDQFKIFIKSPHSSSVTDLLISPQIEFYDKFSKKNKMGVIGTAKIKTAFETAEDLIPGEYQALFELRYQACTKKYCLLPKTVTFEDALHRVECRV